MNMSDVQKKRIRAGHQAASTGIIAQVRDTLQASEKNYSRLQQQLQALKDKLEVLWSLDAEILDSIAPTEEDVSSEIEGADIVREEIEVAVIDIEMALEREKCSNATTLERNPYLPLPLIKCEQVGHHVQRTFPDLRTFLTKFLAERCQHLLFLFHFIGNLICSMGAK